jgi:hypothetical protein
LHAASQDEEERPIWAFFWSQAGGDDLHATSLARGGDTSNQTGLGCIPWAMYGLMRATKHALCFDRLRWLFVSSLLFKNYLIHHASNQGNNSLSLSFVFDSNKKNILRFVWRQIKEQFTMIL